MHAREAERRLGSRFGWIVDGMDNEMATAFGGAPNSEWIIGEDNVILRRRDWSSPSSLRRDLEELVGAVETPTRAEDLDMPSASPPKAAAEGVVPRVSKPGRMIPMVVEPMPEPGGQPYYAKLRVEGDRGAVGTGSGQVYLRFMMDPLYNVHWNNLTDPIEVRIESPEGVEVSPRTWTGPRVEEAEGDIDPREFLVQIKGAEPGDEMTVRARYFACNTEEGWCVPVEHAYRVRIGRDRFGGSVFPKSMQQMFNRMMEQRRSGVGSSSDPDGGRSE